MSQSSLQAHTYVQNAAGVWVPVGPQSAMPVDQRPYLTSLGGPVTANTVAPTTIYTPSNGKAVRLRWLGMSTPPGNSGATIVTVLLGAKQLYTWDMGAPGAFAHSCNKVGAVNETITVTMTVAQTVHVNVDVEEI